MLAFAAVVCAIVTLVCGVVPTWCLKVSDTVVGMTRCLTPSDTVARAGTVRRTFVCVQIGGAVVLLVGMGLVARGFARLERVDAGFTPDHALTVQLSLPPARYATRETII